MYSALVTVLGILGAVMIVLLAAMVVLALVRGMGSRRGLGEGRPLWPGCPSAWLPVEGGPLTSGGGEPWPARDGDDWNVRLTRHRPAGPPARPHSVPLADGGTLLYLPGRRRGVEGWWTVLLPE